MRTASLQHRTTNCVLAIVLTVFLTAAGYTVLRTAVLLGQLSSFATQSSAEHMHASQIKP